MFGKCILNVIPDIKNTAVYKKYRQVRKTGKSIATHLELGGRHLSIQLFKQGDAVGMIAADITERKKLEEALRESEERYRTLYESSRDGIVAANLDGIITECNPAYAEMLGYSREELRKIKFLDIIPPKWHIVNKAYFTQVMENGHAGEFEKEYIRKDGTIFPVSLRSWRVDDASGKSVGVWSIVRDITERKKAEVVSKRSKQLLESTLNSLFNAVFILDDEAKIVDCNTAASEIFGYSREEMLGKATVFLHISEAALSEFRKHLYVAIEDKGFLKGFDFRMKRKDGSVFPTEHSVMPLLDESGNRAGWVSVVHDITERKKAEEQMRATLREKELLLKELNHRVKNNFQLITSILDMVGMRARNEETLRLCASVHARIHAMALIHSQLYTSGSFNQVDLGAHIRELIDYLAQVYAMNGRAITSVTDAAEVHLPITQAVPCALTLNEVLSNSFKHAFTGRQKGVIEIFLRKSADGTVTIRVKDDGVGVPDDFDIDKVNTLGLKLARNLVQEQLNGKFQIKHDEGTEVLIEFKL